MILHFRPKALLIKRESTNVIGCEEDTDIKDKNKWQIDSNTLIAESKYWVSEKLIQSGFNANWNRRFSQSRRVIINQTTKYGLFH